MKIEPLTSTQRAALLFKKTSGEPTEQQVAECIDDAEFDTINFLDTIMKRHGMDGVKNKLVEQAVTIERLEKIAKDLNVLCAKRFAEVEKLKTKLGTTK